MNNYMITNCLFELIINIFLQKVIFSGPANVPATVFDHGNGSYEAIALLVDPGNYTIIAIIERSLCEGLRDPGDSYFATCKYMRPRSNKLNSNNLMKVEEGCSAHA